MKKFSKVMFAAAVVLAMLCTAVFAAPSAVMTNDAEAEIPMSDSSAVLSALCRFVPQTFLYPAAICDILRNTSVRKGGMSVGNHFKKHPRG